jgi:hypothetical protein
VPVATGPDTPHRDIASYPYLIQSQHRSGNAHHCHDGARTTLLLTHGGQTLDLCNFRTKVASVTRDDEGAGITLTPVHFQFDSGLSGSLVTSYRFAGGSIRITRSLTDLSSSDAALELTEYFKGAPGRTEYPEDLHGIMLEMDGDAPQEELFDYSGAWRESKRATSVAARVPQVNTRLALVSEDGPVASAAFCAGHLFSPYFTLKLTRRFTGNGTTQTCLKTTPIAK